MFSMGLFLMKAYSCIKSELASSGLCMLAIKLSILSKSNVKCCGYKVINRKSSLCTEQEEKGNYLSR